MKKKYSLVLIAFLCFVLSGYGQVKIDELTFETVGGYTTSVPEFSDGLEDYFTRTDGSSNIAGTQMVFTNKQGTYFFTVHDTDGDGNPTNLTLNFDNVNISGYSSLELRIHIAEDDDGGNQDWDDDSYMHINGSIDSGGSQNLLWVEATASTNTEPRLDTNFDGLGNGTPITDTFTQLTANIAGTGADLDIEIEFNALNAGDEDIAIDSIEIWGTPTVASDPDLAITGPTDHGSTCLSTSTTTLAYTITNSGTLTAADITVTSGDPQFVVSGLSSTTIAPSGNATYNVTFTPSAVGGQNATINVASTTLTSNSPNIVLTGIGISPPTITTQPMDQTAAVGSNATFTVAATNNTLFQWQVSTDSGTNWTNVGGDSDTYVTAPVTLVNTGDLYRVLVSGNSPCTNIISLEAELTVVNGACVDESFDSFTGSSFSGWTSIGPGFYTSAASSGISPNSVGFNSSNDVLVSPSFVNASSLTFWMKGNGTNAASALLIEGFNGATWVTVDNITNISTTETTVVYDGSSIPVLPNNIQQFRFTYTKSAGNLAFDDVTVICGTPVAGPEIIVSGNSINISDNSTSPATANNTNFGATLINTNIVKTFTIRNIGTTNLLLTGPVTLTDVSAPQEFSITQPTDLDLAVNETTTFTVTFNSAVAGLFTNEISIPNSDSDENPFNYDIVASASDGTVVGTAFAPGDLIFVGYDGQVFGSGSADEYLVATMVEITTGTSFSIVNARYEAGAAANIRTEKWGGGSDDASDPPFQARITYNGTAPIPAGSVLQFVTNNSASWFSFVAVTEGTVTTTRTSDFSGIKITTAPSQTPNISTSSADQIFLIQGDFVSDGTINANEANYFLNGTLLHGLTNRTPWVLLSQACNGDSSGGNSRESRLPSLLTCFNVESANASAASGYYENDKEHGLATVRVIINDVADVTNNWTLSSGRYNLDPTDNSATSAGRTFIIGAGNAAGQWVGDIDSNWFNCANWGGLSVPDASTDVIISSTSVTDAVVDFNAIYSNEFNDLANCNDLTITDRKLELTGSINNKIEVFGNLQLSASGILDMDDTNNATSDGELYLHGNWVNPNNDSFQEGNSTVIFTGSSAQNIVYGGIPLPPTISTEQFYNLVLNNDFDTSVALSDLYMNGNLTINSGYTLTVTDGRYAHVDNIVTNNGAFTIENNGSLVQVQDVDNVGNLTMKRNALIENYDYVYWSSPVSGFNTNDLFNTTSAHLYRWDPIFDNTPFGGSGQGYWVSAANSTMDEGAGYIARSPGYGTPTVDETVFENGIPNNGDVDLNLSRGNDNDGFDGDDDDDDWNLIGNPYPSSISAMAFLTDNANLDGFINVWTHGAPPVTAISDPFYENNEAYNYDADDYIAYNGTGTTCSPSDNTACFDGYVAAGQAFMVNTIDGGSSTTIPISFTNTMRNRAYDNSNFFRLANPETNVDAPETDEKHRIWLDFASENNGVDRTVLGYVTNATMERDRLYDAITSNKESQQNFYSIIGSKAFVIQGRALPFVDTDVIPLGFNSISNDNYTIAINAVDGLFQNQTIYLKDMTLGFIHNLTNAPYTFTSDLGEFNDRFEIVFQDDALSVIENDISSNDVSIIELSDGSVKISVGTRLIIKQVEILDIVGRRIYNLRGNNSTEIYDLSRLSQATYIAKVTLSNGQIMTKKAIKRK